VPHLSVLWLQYVYDLNAMGFSEPRKSTFTRHHSEEVRMAFSAMDCLLLSVKAVYASTELTTGVRLYNALRVSGLKTRKELREKMGPAWFATNIFDPNVEAGLVFARAIRDGARHAGPVITPGPFTAPGWSQGEYLTFWRELISTRISGVWFNRNWQFSNGCAFEFAVACECGVPTLDSSGQSLSAHAGIDLIGAAISELATEGFDTESLRASLEVTKKAIALASA